MTCYNVIIEEAARLDLIDILNYITNDFQEPIIAAKIGSAIVSEINSLREFPKRAHAISDEPYKTMGYRVTYAKNYAIFYKVIDSALEVRIMRVLYNRRNWQNIL